MDFLPAVAFAGTAVWNLTQNDWGGFTFCLGVALIWGGAVA